MTGWQQLETALDAAARRGEMIRFWWRDDDAGKRSPALGRLLDLAESRTLPLALAVVPAWLEPECQGRIAASAEITVLQHGFDHTSHARKGRKSIELGNRSVDRIAAELRQGFALLEEAFGATFLPVLVPPWNRIDEALHPHLRNWGYVGLSVFGERAGSEIARGVALVNTHIDPVDWRGTRGFVGEDLILPRLIDLLDLQEPIGVLTHHLAMDEACWDFVEHLLAILISHPACRVVAAPYLFAPSGVRGGAAA